MNKYGTVCYDFDGVVHSYKQPWDGHTVIPDEPSEGALAHIRKVLKSEFKVAIFSVRSGHEGGCEAIHDWLVKHGLTELEASQIEFPTSKPPALIYIDDRAYFFEGDNWPTLDFIRTFHPWNRNENHEYAEPEKRDKKKPETGPMRFSGDWRGVFIRGKDARKFEVAVRNVLIDKKCPLDKGLQDTLEGLANLFRSADEQEKANVTLQSVTEYGLDTKKV